MTHGETSITTYLGVFVALIGLTTLTVSVAYVNLGEHWNNIVALSISITKATLVALFFMHMRDSKRITWLVVGGGLFWLLVLLGFTISDVATRGWLSL